MVKNAVQAQGPDEMPAEVARLVEERQQARLRKDWEAADVLRQRIAVFGWKVQDTPEGQNIVRPS
jgi:cysteinyl-tRNA synthetase